MGNGQSGASPSSGSCIHPILDDGKLSEHDIDKMLKEFKTSPEVKSETEAQRMKRYMTDLALSKETLLSVTEAFEDELQIGMECHKRHPGVFVAEECSFKSLDSCVKSLPSGNESGIYYALDFGGTNFRVIRLEMRGDKDKILPDVKQVALPKDLMSPQSGAARMFDFFAAAVKELMEQKGDINSGSRMDSIPCGFTFSFPCTLHQINEATLINWTKGFETGRETDDPVEGQDVALLMNHAFQRNGVPMHINCVANDTVGTLLSCAYKMDRGVHPPCMVALILGTGYNACYFEEKAGQFGYQGRIINIESGNFNRALPKISVDHAVDFGDVAGRGRQGFEKMVSGAYIGEICRLVFVKVLQHRAPQTAWTRATFSAEDSACCIQDTSPQLVTIQKLVASRWDATLSQEDLETLRVVCVAVWKRAAALAACCIAACAKKTGYLREGLGGVTVGIDGSLYKCNQFYRQDIQSYLVEILGHMESLVHLDLAEDGSGLGAGILAALVANS